MTCPDCDAPMTHQGYFAWDCNACERRHSGDLPPRSEDVEGAAAPRRVGHGTA